MSTLRSTNPKFSLGEVVATAHAMVVIIPADRQQALQRHARGNWGRMSDEDIEFNELALVHGGRLISAHRSSKGVKFWIITEADRSTTTVLLPDEY